MKYKIIRKNKKDFRDFEIGYASSKEQADGLLSHYNSENEDPDIYYIKLAMTEKQWERKAKRR